jgi:outer membrane protein insertion porin family
MERPRLGNYHLKGIKKSEEEELIGKIGLAKQTIVTENTRRTAERL